MILKRLINPAQTPIWRRCNSALACRAIRAINSRAPPPPCHSPWHLLPRPPGIKAEQLHLPDNSSYRRYTDLRRSAVVWNVVAAPPYSLTLKTWCFPVAGCVGYRGYFSEADARAEAAQTRRQIDLLREQQRRADEAACEDFARPSIKRRVPAGEWSSQPITGPASVVRTPGCLPMRT